MEVHVPASPSAESQEEYDPIIHGDHSEEEEEPQGRHRSDDAPNTIQEEGLEHFAGSEQEAAADVNRNANLAATASSVAIASAPAASLAPLVDDGEEEEGGTDSEDSGGIDSECSERGTSSRGYRCRSCGGTRGGRGFRCRACVREPFGDGGDCGSCGQGMLPRAVVCGGCAPVRDNVDLYAASVGCVVCVRGLAAGADAARRGTPYHRSSSSF